MNAYRTGCKSTAWTKVLAAVGAIFVSTLMLGFVGAEAATRTISVKPVLKYYAATVTGEFDSPEAAFAALQASWNMYPTDPGVSLISREAVNPHRWRPDIYGLWDGQPYYLVTDVVWCYRNTGCSTSYDSGPEIQMLSPRCLSQKVHIDSSEYSWRLNADQSHPPDQTLWCQLSLPINEPDPKSCPSGNPVYPTTGLKVQLETDYSSTTNPLVFSRSYRGDLGRFVTQSDRTLIDNTVALTKYASCLPGTYVENTTGQPLRPYCFPYVSYPATDQSIVVLGSDGRDLIFYGPTSAITSKADVNDRLSQRTTSAGVKEWVLRRASGDTEIYDALGMLRRSSSADARRDVTYSYSDATTPLTVAPRPGLLVAMADQSGRSISLSYSDGARITKMIDPAGVASNYAYDGVGNLTSASYPDGHVRTYLYNEAANINGGAACPLDPTGFPGALTGIAYDGVRFADFKYDCNKRALSSEHAGGNFKYQFAYGSGATTITDPLGVNRTVRYATTLDVARQTSADQPAGSGCAASTSVQTYDANGNILSKDDFNGARACYANNLSRNLETTRVEGLANTTTCSAVTTVNATLPAGSRKISTAWHPDFRLETQRAEPGKLTTSIYNGQPDPFNGNALASCAPSAALLPDGKPIAVLCKQVEQATTDADGHLGLAAALQGGVANRVQQWTYNGSGQLLTATDPLNHTTSYAYYSDAAYAGSDPNAAGHSVGDLQSVTNAAGKTSTYDQYNKHGQVLQSTDPNGVVTINTYDLRQRLSSSSTAGETISYGYDLTGQLITVTLPNGSAITNTYDAAHRLTQVTDGAGNTVIYTVDGMGNRVGEQVKDASGTLVKNIVRSYDALNRLQSSSGAGR